MLLEQHITWAEDERTVLAKADHDDPRRRAVDNAHHRQPPRPSILQRGRNVGSALCAAVRRGTHRLAAANHVHFNDRAHIRTYQHTDAPTVFVTYDSGADGNYISEHDRRTARLPILRPSTKRVGVANGSTSKAANVTRLPFPRLSERAATADTVPDFPTSLMSVGTTSDDGTISIFTRNGVTVHKEQDVIITCQGGSVSNRYGVLYARSIPSAS